MFERFTDRARRVVVLAQEEARMLGHNYIGTEHLLLGLVHDARDRSVAAEALDACGIRLRDVRRELLQVVGHGTAPPSGHIPFTPRAKKVLELSLREALSLGHNYIGTEHILLALIREGEGIAAQVLQRLGADLGRVRAAVVDVLARYGAGGGGSTEPRGWAGDGDLTPEEVEANLPLFALKARALRAIERLDRIEAELGDVREALETLVERLGEAPEEDESGAGGDAAT